MLTTPVLTPSAPWIWGAEGISFPMEEIEIQFNSMEDGLLNMEMINSAPSTAGVETTLSTGKHHYRDFNTLTSALNTPEITNIPFDDKFEDFFKMNDFGNEAMNTFETEMNEPYTAIDTDFNVPEEIWGYQTFTDNDDDFGMCAPPSAVEGTVDNSSVDEILRNMEDQVEVLVEKNTEPTFDIENKDVLQWIIDDQQIDDIPMIENSQQEPTPAIHTVSINLPEHSAPSFFLEEIPQHSQPIIEVKNEDLREDEKYRKMRNQNNEASRKCRLNRKRKLADMEEEYELLQEKNTFLKSRLEEMENEVKVWKKKLLSDISNTSLKKSFMF